MIPQTSGRWCTFTNRRLAVRSGAVALLALACSLALTQVMLSVPLVPGDWARLDAEGVYRPPVWTVAWPSYALQVSLWLGMMVCLMGIGWLWRDRSSSTPATHSRSIPWLLIPILLIGFALRLYNLATLPLLIDEIGFMARGADALHGVQVPIFAPGHNGNPFVYSWLLGGAMQLAGQTPFVVRMVSVACGTLSIAAVYALGCAGWSRRMGVWAAALLAVYPAHIHFSQLALYNIVDPLFALLALSALLRGLKHGSPAAFLWVGLWSGLAQYFYHGSHLLLLVIAWMGWLGSRSSYPWRWRLQALLGWLLPVVIITLPRFAPRLAYQLPLTGNLDGVRLPADLPANTLRAVLAWVGQPDVSPFWLSEARLFPWGLLLLFVIGVIVAMRHIRQSRYSGLLVMLPLVTVFGGVIWAAAPLYVRYVTALPALALLMAQGMQVIGLRLRHPVLRWGVIALLMIYSVLSSLAHNQAARSNVPLSVRQAEQFARQTVTLPDEVAVVLRVPESFSAVERITIADLIAAYGRRRTVLVIDSSTLDWQQRAEALGQNYRLLP
jgi:4-amino-4-deoxy-L-arabinose transferase-like glycosyltransferase